ncbi:MAG: hypothetical protein DI598_11460 [Pseudopedobacter saltans]|uniref:Thioredoxin domain-containing protein n=1 Tax=Pseudopedobacter saltans TaxID=151895 RepID=A0A2W5GUR5_9SPHI|nr:MAG: hypothetical protein DI598_11460 [Pseudopedobacter saltans]
MKILFFLFCSLFSLTIHAQNMLASITENASRLPFQNMVGDILQIGEQLRKPQLPLEKQKLIEKYNVLNTQYQDSIAHYLKAFPNNEKAGYLSLQYFFDIRRDTPFLRKNLNIFLSTGVENKFTQYIKEELSGLDSAQVGKNIPTFLFKDINKQSRTFPNGHKTLFVFWASWCAPCRLETDQLKDQYDNIRKKDIDLVSVDLDDDPNRWLLASKQDQIPWMNCFADGAWESRVARFFTLHQIPQNVLIGSDGKILARNISIHQLLK